MKRHVRALTVLGAVLVLALGTSACSDDKDSAKPKDDGAATAAGSDNPTGRKVKIAFSAPGSDHGWLAAVTKNARDEAAQHSDVELILLEGTNDSAAQVAQVESLITRKPDVLVILPHEGGPLTPVAQKAMSAGIPVVNVDREFSAASAYRTWIGGDNYGIGKAAGDFIADQLKCKGNVVEIQGLAGISVTTLRSQGFRDAVKRCGADLKIVASQPADFVPDKGLTVMETILKGNKSIQAVYTHDDDMAEGVVAAIRNAGRDKEMFLTGAGGSNNAMKAIEAGGLYRATFMYNPSMSASAVRVARLIALKKGFSELVEPEAPSRIQLPASTITKDNVASFKKLGF